MLVTNKNYLGLQGQHIALVSLVKETKLQSENKFRDTKNGSIVFDILRLFNISYVE